MPIVKAVIAEIHDLTAKMIDIGLCRDQNYPSERSHQSNNGSVDEISISGARDISAALKNRPYAETYRLLREKRVFNMSLIDGALVQFRYRFRQDTLVKHALAFYPSPDLPEYQNYPDVFDLEVLFADAIRKDIVTTPIRFDFDPISSIECIHPVSHFTIGQYRNCRIPVLGGLTPHRFLKFILKAFYNTAYQRYCSDWRGSVSDFDCTLTAREKSGLHLSFLK